MCYWAEFRKFVCWEELEESSWRVISQKSRQNRHTDTQTYRQTCEQVIIFMICWTYIHTLSHRAEGLKFVFGNFPFSKILLRKLQLLFLIFFSRMFKTFLLFYCLLSKVCIFLESCKNHFKSLSTALAYCQCIAQNQCTVALLYLWTKEASVLYQSSTLTVL